MNFDYTSPGGTPLERLAQQQAGTHPAPCARSCEANAYEIQIRQLSSERDAMAAKLAELEGQDPVAWMTANREMTSFVNFHDDDLPLYARQVPAERPVNARLLDALKRAKNSIVAFKFVPGGANCWEASDEENLTAVNSAIAAAEAAHTEPVNVDFGKRGENMFFKIDNQSFLLEYKPEEQDEFDFMKAMLLSAFSRITHGVKTEIQPVNTRLLTALKACRNKLAHDASMVAMADVAIMAAEAAPRVARLTDEEIASLLAASDKNSPRVPSFFMTEPHKFARAIETAAIRKNGLAMED